MGTCHPMQNSFKIGLILLLLLQTGCATSTSSSIKVETYPAYPLSKIDLFIFSKRTEVGAPSEADEINFIRTCSKELANKGYHVASRTIKPDEETDYVYGGGVMVYIRSSLLYMGDGQFKKEFAIEFEKLGDDQVHIRPMHGIVTTAFISNPLDPTVYQMMCQAALKDFDF